ncbi:mitochondrial fission ELM1 family protein [Brevundimonas sp.]|uniref:mitochondrial fission ELM1 family protein n=1 Tax=Brevundimonas sp. TaxID=1871086 RepID=UPI0025C0C324|nr:mitochondrial fission ELM1 family protein [Brevundimonas sp.]
MDLTRDSAYPLRIRVVSDGRAGIQNQALGLAEAVQRLRPADIELCRIRWRRGFDKWPSALKQPWMRDPASDAVLPSDGASWPDIWIATGRASLPLSVRAAAAGPGRPFVVQTQDPRWRTGRFDLIIAPEHDGLSGPNVMSILGSPHRITPTRIANAVAAFADRLDPLPHPRVAVLIGGRSASHDLPPDHAAWLADRIAKAVRAVNGSVMVTLSRRTPSRAEAIIRQRLETLPGWVWDGQGDNPYFAFLGAAGHVLVTEDSANMATEAASTGKPVHLLPMVARKPQPKFDRLRQSLLDRGLARPFDGSLVWPDVARRPLAETDRAAQELLRRYDAWRG